MYPVLSTGSIYVYWYNKSYSCPSVAGCATDTWVRCSARTYMLQLPGAEVQVKGWLSWSYVVKIFLAIISFEVGTYFYSFVSCIDSRQVRNCDSVKNIWALKLCFKTSHATINLVFMCFCEKTSCSELKRDFSDLVLYAGPSMKNRRFQWSKNLSAKCPLLSDPWTEKHTCHSHNIAVSKNFYDSFDCSLSWVNVGVTSTTNKSPSFWRHDAVLIFFDRFHAEMIDDEPLLILGALSLTCVFG